MKHEMIFGDPQLFNHAPDDAVLVSVQYGDFIYFTEQNLQQCKSFNINKYQRCDTKLAMRRIIKEPKRWTVEDWKAGQLPDVGCMVVVASVDECASVAAINNDAVCVVFHDGEFTTLHKSGISPIETPEEKAEREEDEFVSLVESKYNHMPDEISFRAGIRAAYRKLKGGE